MPIVYDQLEAGYSIPEGKKFYLIENGKVKQIRSVLNFGNGNKYLIEVYKGSKFYVSPEEFYFVPNGYEMKNIKN